MNTDSTSQQEERAASELATNANPTQAANATAVAEANVDSEKPVVSKSALEQSQRNEIQMMIGARLHQHRSASWEDDISRNTLDTKPFVNLPAPDTFDEAALENSTRVIDTEMLAGRSIMEMSRLDSMPIPSPEDREGYSPGMDGNYWISGLNDHLKIMQVAQQRGVDVKSYFDFGCATGRVIRHFAAQSKTPEIWGSDINARHIRWLYEHMPMSVKPIANHCIPTLPIPDNSIDVISAFSVFTHIDTFETCWLAELNRILRPGGFAYLTVHNEATWNVLRGEMDNPNNRLIQSVLKVDPDFATAVHEPMPDTRTIYRFTNFGPYRAQVFHSDNYLKRVWGRFFNVDEILNCHHVRQTVVILSKK